MTDQNQLRNSVEEAYNAFPYESFSFSHTHPTHLYSLGKLFGLKPTPLEKARVLELGCAAGGNLIPMAYHFPTGEFLGIDFAERQVNDGLKAVIDLGLDNLTLRHQSIMDFSPSEGKFDYIICHGVYSWVDDEIKDKILSICKENLSTNGIAYVSYNTFPGWNMANSVRDLMVWHTKNIADPAQKVQQARAILQFITDGLQTDNSPYANFLRSEIQLLSRQSDSYILHEHLSHFNTPILFHQFIERAQKHKLNYLADTFLATMYRDNLAPKFATELNKVNDSVVVGQYMDFIRNQRFRCTLMCHQSQTINRNLNTKDVESYYLQLTAVKNQPEFTEKDVDHGKEVSFSSGNVTYTARSKLAQLAMIILHDNQHRVMHYNELCDLVMSKSGEKNRELVQAMLNDDLNLMRLIFAGIVSIQLSGNKFVSERSDKPVVCGLARYQAGKQRFVTNRRHQPIMLDPLTQMIIPLMDGTHDLAAIKAAVHENLANGKLTLRDEQGQPVTDEQETIRRVDLICSTTLDNLAKQALYVASNTDRTTAKMVKEPVGAH